MTKGRSGHQELEKSQAGTAELQPGSEDMGLRAAGGSQPAQKPNVEEAVGAFSAAKTIADYFLPGSQTRTMRNLSELSELNELNA